MRSLSNRLSAETEATADESPSAPGRRVLTIGLLLAIAVIAVEVTVVVTALPTVAGELGGLELFPWVFSAYLLTSTVTVPIFGKLADLFGRKPIFLGGMAVFLLGSVLCGLASSMSLLVAFRALQGLGAGAVSPMVFTVIGDVYPLQERGRIQGFLSAVWGIASVAGPALGAFLTIALSWRFVFFVSLPFGLVASWFIWQYLHENVQRHRVAVDYAGALAISGGLLALLVAALEGGRAIPWQSPAMIGLVALGLALLGGFIAIERRAEDPLLPLGLFELPIVAVASVCNLLQGALLFALNAYIPLYVQGVRGENAAGAGAALTPLLVGWSISSTFGPRLLLRFGFRPTALIATGLVMAGALPLLALGVETPGPLIWLSMALLGIGFGPSMTAFMVAVQEAVPWALRGVATSSQQLFRSLGGTIGVALLGALLNNLLRGLLPSGELDTRALLSEGARGAASAENLAVLRGGLAAALHPVFVVLVVLAALGLAVVLRFAGNVAGNSAGRRAEAGAPGRHSEPSET